MSLPDLTRYHRTGSGIFEQARDLAGAALYIYGFSCFNRLSSLGCHHLAGSAGRDEGNPIDFLNNKNKYEILKGMTDSGKNLIKLSKRAYFLMGQRRYREAEKVFLDAYAVDSTNAYILVGLGDVCRKLKNFEQAVEYYDQILKQDPENVFALRGIGNAFRGLRSPEKSIPYWERYLRCNPEDSLVMVRLADSLRKLGDNAAAERVYHEALKLGSNDKFACLGLGNLYYKSGESEKAAQWLGRFLEHDRNNIAALTMLGNLSLRRKEFAEGETCFRRALVVEPDNVFALTGLAGCLRGQRRLDEAIVLWRSVLEQEPNNQGVLTRLGDALLNTGDARGAEACYHRSLEVGFDQYAWLGLANLFLRQKDLVQAEHCCEQILDRYPGNIRALHILFQTCEAGGDQAKADQLREQLLQKLD